MVDAAIIALFAAAGSSIAVLSLAQVRDVVVARVFASMPVRGEFVFVAGMSLLTGFGFALGRLARSNSWHVWTAPEALAHDIVEVATSAQGITLTLVSALLLASAFAFGVPPRRYGQGRNTRRRMSMECSSTAPRSVDDSADT